MSVIPSELEMFVSMAIASDIEQGVTISRNRIREHVDRIRIIYAISDKDAEQLARLMESRHDVTMSVGSILTDSGHEPWLEAAQAEIEPFYWSRYKRLLSRNGFSGQVLAKIDDTTNRILGQLENPEKAGPWDRRGMVVGHVQSGKTANYIGLTCKAADAGYKFIVVIAGIQNNLRNQTQTRIDEGFIGRDSGALLQKRADKFIGVGAINPARKPVTFTNSQRDFNKATAASLGLSLQNLKDPAILVIKKNSSILKHLVDWLKEHSASGGGTISEPMILIDDEADNASINVSHDKGEISRINGQIRELLNIFDRSCYIGYTATPFANIFIDPETSDDMVGDDLFPKHFILSLDPPSNYFGAQQIFLDEDSDYVRSIQDNDSLLPVKHDKDFILTGLPMSLLRAIRTFVLVCAIRIARGEAAAHNSMLVNVSRFVKVQAQVRNEIHEVLARIQDSARLHGRLSLERALNDPEIRALHRVWSEEFAGVELPWEKVQQHLHDATAPIKVVEVNSKSSGALNYAEHERDGLSVIAVGGMALSRGLTLEGLSISYVLRNTVMYDTLMQMGRWFGYRPGYEDLCRIWLTSETRGWYEHIAESIEELREEFRLMESVGATPADFGLKVRSHPDTLIVTAQNKMGTGQEIVVSVGLANKFIETAVLKDDDETLGLHREAAARLSRSISAPLIGEDTFAGRLIKGADVDAVLEFLATFRNHPLSELTETGPIRDYIEVRMNDELNEWDVLFAGIRRTPGPTDLVDLSLGFSLTCQRRTRGKSSVAGKKLLVSDKRRVASRGIERIGLTEHQVEAARSGFEAELVERYGDGALNKKVNYPDLIYRNVRERPLLIIHLLAIGDKDADLSKGTPVVAWGISFPSTKKKASKATYVVGAVWRKEFLDSGYDSLDDDDE